MIRDTAEGRASDADHLDRIRVYLDRLAAGDGPGVAELFAEDGVIDDFSGGHHEGRAAIDAFVRARAGNLTVDGPLNVISRGDRVNVYGRVVRPGQETAPVRWVFHFDGAEISHLGNSRVVWLHGVE